MILCDFVVLFLSFPCDIGDSGMGSAPLLVLGSQPIAMLLCLYTSLYYVILLLSHFPLSVFFFLCCVSHLLPLPLSSCLGCIPPPLGLPFLRSLLRNILCGSLLFISSVRDFVCVCVSYLFVLLSLLYPFLATMSFAGYFIVRCLVSAFPAFFFILFFSSKLFPVLFGLVPSTL